MFHLYFFAVWALVVWRVVRPMHLWRPYAIVVSIALLVLMQHHLITRLVSGNMFSPELPFGVIAAIAWGFGSVLTLAGLIAVFELASLILRWTGLARKTIGPGPKLALVGVSMLVSALGVYQAVQVPQVRRIELPVVGLPRAMDGLRMVQLSDPHISRLFPASWVREVVARTNALQPDLIVITGDLIDGTVDARAADVAPLADLRATHGVIAIPGNHEYYFDETKWSAAFRELGMRVLLNEHVQIGKPDSAVAIVGITDEAAAAYGKPGPDVRRTLRDVPAGLPVLLLSHRPADVVPNAQRGIAMQLSGHTHGGMVRGFDAIVGRANGGYVSGLYKVGPMWLYVSNGTGIWNGFPIRLGVPAEITEFVLRTPK